MENRLLSHGQICYLEIPAIDPVVFADFCEQVFGWKIDRAQNSFESPGLIGYWEKDRAPAAGSGLVLWVHVKNISSALELVQVNGGEIRKPPSGDGPRMPATILDLGSQRDRDRTAQTTSR